MPKSTRAISKGLKKDEKEKAPKRTPEQKLETELSEAMALIKPKAGLQDVSGKSSEGMSSQELSEWERGKRKSSGLESAKKLSAEKHVENMRHKIAYVADSLIEELAHEASKKTKKDKEYLKGLTWSFGTLYDKLRDVNTESKHIALPQQLLRNITEVMKLQAETLREQAKQDNVRISPEVIIPTVQDDKGNYVGTTTERSAPDSSTT